MIVTVHWIADFVCQTDRQALGKSKEWSPLLDHTLNYSLIWGLIIFPMAAFYTNPWMLLFPVITFVAHTATDFYTSRVNSILAQKESKHDFFVSIGFDQLLHYMQLFVTYQLLK